MEERGPNVGNVSACELCHRRKVRCSIKDGDVTCNYCKSVNQACVPHLRKRKHGPLISTSTAKRAHSLVSTGTPSPLPQSSPLRPTVDQSLGHSALYHETETSPGSYLGRTEYVNGTVPIDEEDAGNYSSGRRTKLAEADKRYLIELRAFDSPTRSLRDSLIAAFMEHCYPWMPIVEQQELRSSDSFKPSLLLLHSVFVAGSRVSLSSEAQASGDMFYRRAKALFHLGYEKDTMTVVRSICLLLWFNNSGPEHISMDASSFWLHMGVALAHQLGLHRQPRPGSQDATLRRRLWWTLVIRDCQIATSHGRPRMINPKDCDVHPLTIEDLPQGSLGSMLFVAYHGICSLLTDLTEALVRGTLGSTKQVSIQTQLLTWIHQLPESLRICDKQSNSLLPYDLKARQLHVMFFTAIMLLFRPDPHGQTVSGASILASSFSAGIFEDFYTRGELKFLAPVFNFHLMTAAFAQVACYRVSCLWPRAESELNIINKCLTVMAERYPTAIGAQRVIKASLRAVRTQSRQEDNVRFSLEREHTKYFSHFSPELCSKWSLLFADGSASSHHVNPPSNITSQAVEINPHQRSPCAEGGHQALGPHITPASVQSNYTAVDPTLSQPLQELSPESYFASNGAFTAVGNWMLGDWTAGLDWMNDDYTI
ncbi:hypothetical protein K491DRAFT_585585 [Lophiostoma macrostomum CBS 122681]|uniref:Zn(2)-C6 fungal-type domain-containing protein n=1 Tax=Lophiostoma macrostomum CBS 122681 TaxID=1314788 RepID=A0A6A6TSQ6_9PLEO|nr:hypothetical protein K491DRAFT_585585 [Lophiostoma macrostomum CBS 122681]